MSDVKIIKNDGTIVSIPEGNLENFQRLNGHLIKEILRENTQSYEDILDELENETSAIEIITPAETDPVKLRRIELVNSDKDVLIMLANEIAENKKIKKVHNRAGVEKLADYIIENS